MQQQPKHTMPEHLSANYFLLNQLLLPLFHFPQKIKKSHEMSRGKKNSNNYFLLSFTAVGGKKPFSKMHNKSKCNSQKKISNQEIKLTCQEKVQKIYIYNIYAYNSSIFRKFLFLFFFPFFLSIPKIVGVFLMLSVLVFFLPFFSNSLFFFNCNNFPVHIYFLFLYNWSFSAFLFFSRFFFFFLRIT